MSSQVDDLVGRAREGDVRATARLVSLVEDASPLLREVAAALAPHTGRAVVIGLTGAPGVGKSTTTSALVRAYREQGKRVGVLAVDPSSPFTGGALLGDRIRMQEHATDPDVFIRSMATRGHLGGLAWATPQAIRILDAAGYDIVLVETVGVGQSEVEVAATADTTVVLLAPGLGDGVQAAKAGLLEVADVFVVNKADRDGADETVRDLKQMLTLADSRTQGWATPVLKSVASRREGIDEILDAVQGHRAQLVATGSLSTRRRDRAAAEIEAVALASVRTQFGGLRAGDLLTGLADDVAQGATDPYAAADRLLASVTDSSNGSAE